MRFLSNTLLLIISFFLVSCSYQQGYVGNRLKSADRIAERNHFSKKLVKGGKFWLQTYQRVSDPSKPYIVYLEGDGLAFKDRYTISDDPTPLFPTVLRLAAMDTRANVIYIAKPCQYVMHMEGHVCHNIYWTDQRMSREIVNAMNEVIEEITNKHPIDLIGYSGGGGIATLISAQNPYVKSIITIAGNLDHRSFNKHHKAKQMIGSLNPIDYADKVKHIPQRHLSGGKDKIVPPFITNKYVKQSDSKCVHQEIIQNASHDKGWDEVWEYILSTPFGCQ